MASVGHESLRPKSFSTHLFEVSISSSIDISSSFSINSTTFDVTANRTPLRVNYNIGEGLQGHVWGLPVLVFPGHGRSVLFRDRNIV